MEVRAVFLVGFMGAGNRRVGRELAARVGCRLTALDAEHTPLRLPLGDDSIDQIIARVDRAFHGILGRILIAEMSLQRPVERALTRINSQLSSPPAGAASGPTRRRSSAVTIQLA